MIINSVQTNDDIAAFHRLPYTIYTGDPHWIAPIRQEVESVFDPKQNKFFEHGCCERWLLKDNDGRVIGRIAAFIDERTAHAEAQPTGGCGFFECIANQQAAFLLFDTARDWLLARGMEAMDGPINFGERNAWWGLLVAGFTAPTYQVSYNPSYYEEFFDGYGFQTYFKQYSYSMDIHAPRPERYTVFHERLLSQGYSFAHADKDTIEKAADDFRHVYNLAWQKFNNFHEMTAAQSLSLLKKMKPVLLDYLIWFAYYEGEAVAMFVMLPELNQWFKHVHGNFNLFGKLKFLFYKIFGKNDKVFGMVFGVVPQHQQRGVEAGIVLAADKVLKESKQWKEIELTWVGDFNPRMINTCETLGAKLVKTHITYRKLFDSKKKFERHPILP